MLHTTTQGPFYIDPSYNNIHNENFIIMNMDIYKHIDYLSILLFNTTLPALNILTLSIKCMNCSYLYCNI